MFPHDPNQIEMIHTSSANVSDGEGIHIQNVFGLETQDAVAVDLINLLKRPSNDLQNVETTVEQLKT